MTDNTESEVGTYTIENEQSYCPVDTMPFTFENVDVSQFLYDTNSLDDVAETSFLLPLTEDRQVLWLDGKCRLNSYTCWNDCAVCQFINVSEQFV